MMNGRILISKNDAACFLFLERTGYNVENRYLGSASGPDAREYAKK
jgi:hypothetical protein